MYFTPVEASPSPESVALALAPLGGLCWLDGGLEHGEEGRWSFVAADPAEVRRVPYGQVNPLRVFAELDLPESAGELPLRGPLAPEEVPRWMGYVAYDAQWSGKAEARQPRAAGQLAVYLMRPQALYAYDHEEDAGFAIGDRLEAVDTLAARLRGLGPCPAAAPFAVHDLWATPEADHMSAVQRAVEHMRAGDIYQVNLARRWRGRFEGSPLDLWRAMRSQSPVPLGSYIDAGDHQVLACTMERFVRLTRSDGALWTSPIKGTVARAGRDQSEQRALESDAKERIEHSMVVDLMRNDLGRVAQYGSVHIDPLMQVQPFAGLHHLVSTVHAQADEGLELDRLMEATFPPGSVTGTPKQRAMEIIEQLEPCARGAYCGAVGFVDRAGGCSWAVAIRTAQLAAGQLDYHAGGGLVVQSDAQRETAETELKARVFLDALKAGAAKP